jgi:DUF2075 family protein
MAVTVCYDSIRHYGSVHTIPSFSGASIAVYIGDAISWRISGGCINDGDVIRLRVQ